MSKVSLLGVIHDPKGRNLESIKLFGESIKELYKNTYITISEETHEHIYNSLKSFGFNIKIIEKRGAADARRQVLRFALEEEGEFYHYIDLDRLLTWIKFYKEELKEVIEIIPNYDYLILGRTNKAFETHPTPWKETERITNRIFSLEIKKEADVTAGSCCFSQEVAKGILKYSKDKMTDGEWPMIAYRILRKEVKYKAVDGLLYNREINGVSKDINESDEYFSRLRLSYIISESSRNTGKNNEI